MATAAADEFQLVVPCYASGHFVRLVLPGANRTIQIAEISMYDSTSRTRGPEDAYMPPG